MTLVKIIQLEIEIHYNPILKKKPYLVKIYNWNNNEPEELRLEQNEIDNLYKILKEKKYL
jgi:hypothetical protein